MDRLFLSSAVPSSRLIDCISILGLSVKTLRSKEYLDIILNNLDSGKPEIILQLPPTSQFLQSSHLEVVSP